ncbi:matrix-remodeling-associated protein 7 isoform X3 [Strigops habroptila]|uniref:matrix-remodeling-associated protein 7 isoform X3 n=1 Tax=Strigops habroptila TaxID=2489341 RepID=UPI0011D01DF9|nr:matrix-remodeling-associated protein 7 isoform X3 [Strigops habroptila]
MDVAVDLYLAVPLLFTVLALVLASVFVRLRGAEGERAAAERPREPAAAEPARESGPGDRAAAGAEPEAGRDRLPVEEVGAVEEGKEAAAEQREEAAEEPGPAAEPSPAAAESIPRQPPAEPRGPESVPRQPPAEPRGPEPREDAESKIPPLGASAGSSPGHMGQVEDAGDHAALSSKAEEEDLDSENEKLVVREPEDEDAADETFSFKYSPGKLRGNQYKSMMTKEELEEEQRPGGWCKGPGCCQLSSSPASFPLSSAIPLRDST